jgi:hypothetical protein
MINLQGLSLSYRTPTSVDVCNLLFENANGNSNLWAELQWISGGDLNHGKCFSYYIDPHYDYSTDRVKYTSKNKAPGEILMKNLDNYTTAAIIREEPHIAQRTLGVHLALNGNSR